MVFAGTNAILDYAALEVFLFLSHSNGIDVSPPFFVKICSLDESR